MIELTSEQQLAIDEANGHPAVVVDRRTGQTYQLVRIENGVKPKQEVRAEPGLSCPEMADGVRRSLRAIRRDLPELMANRRNRGKFVCYHLEKRIGIDKDKLALIREVVRLDISDDEYIIERIEPGAGNEEELEL